MREYVIGLTDKMLKTLGMEKTKARKHELIRCRDCANFYEKCCLLTHYPCLERDFCSWAERKEE